MPPLPFIDYYRYEMKPLQRIKGIFEGRSVNALVGTVLFVIFFMAYMKPLSHVLFYQEQHHLFLFSHLYFTQQLASHGWMSYLADFIIQFFYYPVLGSILMALLLTAIYFLAGWAIRLLIRRTDVLQLALIPAVATFFYTMAADHSLTTPLTILFVLIALDLLVWLGRRFLFKSRFPFKELKKGWLTFSFLVVYLIGGYLLVLKNYNLPERLMLKTEQYVKAGDWNHTLEYTNHYLESGRTNQLISYFHTLALYHLGQLPYHLLDYPPVLGVKTLYFPWDSNSRESEYGHFLYEELGYINEAQRWEFESMVVWGETAPHLINLAKYNIVNHRPRVAQRFINVLKQSLFYQDTARQLEDCLRVGHVPGLRNALNGVVDRPARFANVINIGPELAYLCEKDPKNKMAFEYLMADLLLGNNVERFAESLHFIRNFHVMSLPPMYEEALLIYKLKVGEDAFRKLGFPISRSTEERFQQYYNLAQSGQAELLQEQFGSTYWYYINYVSPYANKAITH